MKKYDEGDIVEFYINDKFGMMSDEGPCVCERNYNRNTGNVYYVVSISCAIHCKNYGTTWFPLDHENMFPLVPTVMK